MPPALEAAFSRLARQGASAALARVSSGEFNRLGLTPRMSLARSRPSALSCGSHSADLGKPAALAKAFDPAPMRTLFDMAREGARCQLQGIGKVAGLAAAPQGCDLNAMFADHRGKDDIIGKIAEA